MREEAAAEEAKSKRGTGKSLTPSKSAEKIAAKPAGGSPDKAGLSASAGGSVSMPVLSPA